MAAITVTSKGLVFVLELSAPEAQYVADALQRVEPAHLDEDSAYDVLSDALYDSGVGLAHGAALSH